MTTPEPWQFALLAAAAFRITRLVGWDDLTAGLRASVCGVSDAEYQRLDDFVSTQREDGLDPWQRDANGHPVTYEGDGLPITARRYYVAKLIHCPWCCGWWISLLIAVAWWADGDATLLAALPFALSAAVGLAARWLDP